MAQLAMLLVRFRWAVIVAVAAVSAWLVPGVFRLGFGYSVESFLRTDDPELRAAVRHYEEGFSVPDTLCFFGFETAEPLGDAALGALAAFEESVAKLPGVERVVTALSAPGLAGLSRDVLRERLGKSRMYRRLLVSLPGDGTGALAGFFEFRQDARNNDDRERVLGAVEAIAAETIPGMLHVVGLPVLRHTYVRLLRHDQRTFIPVAGVLTAILLLFLVPGLGLSLATMSIVPLTVGWTFGFLGHNGHDLVLLTSMLPTLLMVIAVADAVHMSLRFREERTAGSEREGAATRAVRAIAFPCLLTSVTTAIGFGSLTLASIPDLVDFGRFAVLGVTLAFVLTVVVLPALLPPMAQFAGESRIAPEKDLAHRLGRFARRLGTLPAKPVLVASALAVATCILLASRVTQDSFLTEDLWPDTPVVRSLQWFEERFVSPLAGEILITPKKGELLDPAAVGEVRAFLRNVEQHEGVIRTVSHVDAFDDGLPRIMLPLLTSAPMALLDEDLETARAIVFMHDVGGNVTEQYFAEVRELASGLEHVDARPAGLQVLANRVVTGLIEEIKASFFLAFGLISVLMALVFRSVRYGLIALVPNLLPLLATLAFMGAAGIRLRTVVVMTFAIAFGLAVDNTIHILTRYRSERARGHDPEAAVGIALDAVGSAVWTTSLLLLVGFGVLLWSGFKASFDFGLLACTTVVAALVGDLVVLPALLRVAEGSGSGAAQEPRSPGAEPEDASG